MIVLRSIGWSLLAALLILLAFATIWAFHLVWTMITP